MLKSHEKFHSSNGMRKVLIADDEPMNREMLGAMLAEEYELIYACDGQEAIDQIRERNRELSAVLLDLMMPKKPGLEVLREAKSDELLKNIPIIVVTADQGAEVESLKLGAIDYIPKPYPDPSIVLARVQRAVELAEDRETLQITERDPLTNLYNREFFYLYADQYDKHHQDLDMDAIIVDINNFHMINERFGNAYGDEVLRSVAEKIRESVAESDGIVCRRSADTFMVYCPHGLDYKKILENASVGIGEDDSINNRLRLRMGVYENVDKTLDIERRFDRAKMASDTVKGSFTKTIGRYDQEMHERDVYSERLIDGFSQAISQKQFKVYYQPKFDVRPKMPALISAEALVRWQHPELGLVSPGVFIPLFENNGLIRELDYYVWNEAARQIREWKDELGFSVPVSVNVSRIDLYDPELVSNFEEIIDNNGLASDDILLEITESAYTQDSKQIIETVNELRNLGFKIEMDDFGTGYSSLNMISALPIDALKLDMQFVRSAFKDQQDTRMLEVIIEIADHLGVPVIAEGVETEEQLIALKDLGTDIAQGYFFSKPVPAEDFRPFIESRKELEPEDLEPEVIVEEEPAEEEDAEQIVVEKPVKKAVKLKAINFVFASLAILIALALIISNALSHNASERIEEANSEYIQTAQAANDLQTASDHLTESVRAFAVTGDIKYMNEYFTEVYETRTRDDALETLDEVLDDENKEAYNLLSIALDHSNELMLREYESMRLAQIAYGYADSEVPQEVSGWKLTAAEKAMDPEQMRARAASLVFDDEYASSKEEIRKNVSDCTDQLLRSAAAEVERSRAAMDRFLLIQNILLIMLILAVIAELSYITLQVRMPLSRLVDAMCRQQLSEPHGAEELQFVARIYNEILDESAKAHKQLSYEATHDPLTGINNRSAYELYMDRADKEHIALMIIDVDEFKKINDTYGHDVGDRVLKKVADILKQSFRSVDCVCRLGGDECVVVMTRASSTMRQLVINKIAKANGILQHPMDGLPKVSLSVGVAFSDRENPTGDIFKDADTALYQMKKAGRGGCAVYGDKPVQQI